MIFTAACEALKHSSISPANGSSTAKLEKQLAAAQANVKRLQDGQKPGSPAKPQAKVVKGVVADREKVCLNFFYTGRCQFAANCRHKDTHKCMVPNCPTPSDHHTSTCTFASIA